MEMRNFDELVQGIDFHLKRLDEFTFQLKEMKQIFLSMEKSKNQTLSFEMEKLRKEVEGIKKEFQKRGFPFNSDYENFFTELKETIMSPTWPQAVSQEHICNTEDLIEARASYILTHIVGDTIESKNFLDYGCGRGHVVRQAQTLGAQAFGYDINVNDAVDKSLVTDKWDDVRKKDAFNIILLHDVLDHITVDPIHALKEINSVLAMDGAVFVRCHPWSCSTGSHLYEKLNKAFVHLVADETELIRMGGYMCEHNLKVVRPLDTYRHWFKQAGFVIKQEIPITDPVDDFFFQPSIFKDRILEHWGGNEMEARSHMEIQSVEYKLEKDLDYQIF